MLAAGAAAAEPVPLSAMVIGVSVLLCVMLSVPVRAPAAVGVKLTSTVQLCPVASAVPQVPPARAKSPLVARLSPLSALPFFRLA